MKLSKQYGEKLLRLARSSIENRLKKGSGKVVDESLFSEKRGTFVTLKKRKQLRGCIGNIEPVRTIGQGVASNAVSAALFDSRFPPLTLEELEEVTISVSVLTQAQKLFFSSEDDLLAQIRKGVDGVILRKGNFSATFLPQVWEQLPAKELFLSHLCLKAGLADGCWRDEGVEIEVYQVQIFSEDS